MKNSSVRRSSTTDLGLHPPPGLADCLTHEVPGAHEAYVQAVKRRCGVDLSRLYDLNTDRLLVPEERVPAIKACLLTVREGRGDYVARAAKNCGIDVDAAAFGPIPIDTHVMTDGRRYRYPNGGGPREYPVIPPEILQCLRDTPDFDVGYIDRVREICRYDLLDPKF